MKPQSKTQNTGSEARATALRNSNISRHRFGAALGQFPAPARQEFSASFGDIFLIMADNEPSPSTGPKTLDARKEFRVTDGYGT
jgi:hypothetical protein